MNRINLNGAWPILAIVTLFLILPFATLPGLFNAVFIVLAIIALGIAVLTIVTLVTASRRSERRD